MDQKVLVAALTKVIAATTIPLFRGTLDTLISEIDPRFKGDGVFGKGTYFGIGYKQAWEYASGGYLKSPDNFSVISEYRGTFDNLITISEADIEGLKNAQDTNYLTVTERGLDTLSYEESVSYPADYLTSWMSQDGYDGIRLWSHAKGIPDGGLQVIIPLDSDVQPVLKNTWVILKDKEDTKTFAAKMDLKPDPTNGHIKIPPDKTDEADQVLNDMF